MRSVRSRINGLPAEVVMCVRRSVIREHEMARCTDWARDTGKVGRDAQHE